MAIFWRPSLPMLSAERAGGLPGSGPRSNEEVGLQHGGPGAVIHRHVALIVCDEPATLKDTLRHLEDMEVDLVQLGELHLALPARDVELVLERMREHGQFPRLVGERLLSVAGSPQGEETR